METELPTQLVEHFRACGRPILSYAELEQALEAHGADPFDEALYASAVSLLQQAGFRLVFEVRDEPSPPPAVPHQEVREELKALRRELKLQRGALLSAWQERRLLEIFLGGWRLNAQDPAERPRWRLACAALRLLLEANTKLVWKEVQAHASQCRHLEEEDLFQEGQIGLFRALERFDLSLRGRLSTYALWWIKQSIQRAVHDKERSIRLPVHFQETLQRVREQTRSLTRRLGRAPSVAELAQETALPLEKLHQLQSLELRSRVQSLNEPLGDGEGERGALVPSFYPSPEMELLSADKREQLEKWVPRVLSPRHSEILALRMGLAPACGNSPWTLERVGKAMGLTRERIRQIESKALQRLQKHPRIQALAVYLDD